MQRGDRMDSTGATARSADRPGFVARLLHLLIVCSLALAFVAPHIAACGESDLVQVVESTHTAQTGGDVADLHTSAQHCDGHRLAATNAASSSVEPRTRLVAYARSDDQSGPLADIDPLRKPPRA